MTIDTQDDETSYDAWFLHDKLLLNLLSSEQAGDITRQLPGPDEVLSAARRTAVLEHAVQMAVAEGKIASVDEEHLKNRLHLGQLVWLEQAIAFKGVERALGLAAPEKPAYASFSSALATDKSFRVTGKFNVGRLTSQTAATMLSGTRRQFILGYVEELSPVGLGLRPIVIATRWFGARSSSLVGRLADHAHLPAVFVDQFAGVDFSKRVSTGDLAALRGLPERRIKEAFASIIGEPDVPNDWGGEQFDLWTTRVSVDGRPLRAAFLFKGPARFHPMTIADLGKNGDQIDRLFHTAADLVVVQHCHSITAPIVNMLRTYATHPRNLRRYMTLDGFETLAILRHFGHLT